MRQTIKTLLSFVALQTMCFLAVNATVYTGKCGENATYKLDTETGQLKITGTGETASGDSDPYTNYSNQIKSVVIGEGITKLHDGAFYGFRYIETVKLPGSLVTIGENAFYSNENLQEITLPANVTTIGSRAFLGCSKLRSITIPEGVTTLSPNLLASCLSLEDRKSVV